MCDLVAALEAPKKPTAVPSVRPSILFKRASFAGNYGYLSTFAAVAEVCPKANKSIIDNSNELCCTCKKNLFKNEGQLSDTTLLEKSMTEREEKLRQEFKEKKCLIERFDLILQNEQARTSCMLREARRERKEKISALQQQLECKNMAGLMYVMCAERTKCKVEKMKIIELFTNYINMLNKILADGQNLILNLSRGYKTAARVDYEWQQKMKKIVNEFKAYICNYSDTPLEQNQYLFDLPKLLKCNGPKEDDPREDPIDEEDEERESIFVSPDEDLAEGDEQWWQQQDRKCRPFAVFGDMSSFKPPHRREALKKIKAAKTAPKRWKQYVFHDMFLNSHCPNMELIKNEYFNRIPESQINWNQCLANSMQATTQQTNEPASTPRQTAAQSIDLRGNMGSILKIISTTTGTLDPLIATKTNLLGARDSMEIVSTTKLREKSRSQDLNTEVYQRTEEIKVGARRTSFYDAAMRMERVKEDVEDAAITTANAKATPIDLSNLMEKMNSPEEDDLHSNLAKEHTDSLDVIPLHVPDRDHVISYEKKCPMKSCQRRHVDSFMNSLPQYMRASPFTHFEETYDNYEPCTPEQLAILKQRLDEKKKSERKDGATLPSDPLEEWMEPTPGIGVQTSDLSYLEGNLPPCTCRDSNHSTETGPGAAYKIEELIPLKQNLDEISKECFWNDQIQFNRFKVVGEDSGGRSQTLKELNKIKSDFTKDRVREIKKILKQHPSLLDIFQANTRC